ncbi:MAG: ribokinase [Spirochaetota bacterium]
MHNKRSRIVVVGSYAVGMTMSCARFPTSGETVKGSNFKPLHGGKGSNQAIAVARLGGQAVFGSCVGVDQFGDSALEMLSREGIDTSYVKRSPAFSTGVGFVIVDQSGHNEIVIDLGANEDLDKPDMDAMAGAIQQSNLLLVQLETNLGAVIRAMELASAAGVPIILNPAPFQKLPERVVKMASFITPNETEAMAMLGLEGQKMLDGKELARELHRKFGVTAVVTLGHNGAHIVSTEVDQRLPAYDTTVKDTTGAGDTFSAAMAVALGEGKSIVDAVDFANKAAGHSVAVDGVVESIPTRNAVDNSTLQRKKQGTA